MNSLGVVNPMGLPAPVGRWISTVPRAAWMFFGAAVVVVFADFRNALGLGLTIDVRDIVIVGASTGLLIALPGIALVRNPSVPTQAPVAYRGLILIALGAVVSKLVNAVLGSEFGAAADSGIVANIATALVHASGSIVSAVGWLAVARALSRREVLAGSRVTALATVSVVAIVGTVFTGLGSTVRIATDGMNDPSYIWLAGIGSAAYLVIALSWAALAWTFIRSMSSNRSGAVLAAGLWSLAIVIGAGLALVSSATFGLALIGANLVLWNAIGQVITLLPPIFLAAAVAFGLLGPRDAAPNVEPTASS
ncbi:MAG: hypothetical protein ABI573_05390 [Chloroflexota bacterium]